MAKGGQTTTQKTGLDPSSQRYVDATRGYAQQGASALQGGGPLFMGADPRSIMEQIQPFMDPYQSQVIDGVRSEYDHLRAGAQTATADAATRAGAFGGSRHGVAEAARMGELDRAQTSQIGGLLSQNFQNALGQGLQYSEYQRALQERMLQEPLFRQQQQLQMMNLGMGPTGQVSTTTTPPPSLGGQIAGAALTGAGLFMGGPAGAAVGSRLAGGGGGGGLFDMGQPGPHPWYRGR